MTMPMYCNKYEIRLSYDFNLKTMILVKISVRKYYIEYFAHLNI